MREGHLDHYRALSRGGEEMVPTVMDESHMAHSKDKRDSKLGTVVALESLQSTGDELAIFDQLTQAVLSCNSDGRITSVNLAATRVFNLPASSVVGERCEVLLASLSVLPEPLRQALAMKARWHGALQLRTSAGDRVVDLRIAPQSSTRGGFYCLLDDKSELVEMEERLRTARQLASVGKLSAGIAHEINTPTQYVSDNTDFLRDAFGDLASLLRVYERLYLAAREQSVTKRLLQEVERAMEDSDLAFLTDEIPRAVEESLEGLSRVSKIVSAMRDFAYHGAERQPVNINKVVSSTITVARNEWKYVAEMECNLDTDIPKVSCIAHELNQVVLNLIVNAAHAIADATALSQIKGKISIATYVQGEEWVVISVSDNGCGIPEWAQPKLFDPFFTTKEHGKGTGQGLAISYSVIEALGGKIDFETEEGRGTTFRIFLPIEPGVF